MWLGGRYFMVTLLLVTESIVRRVGGLVIVLKIKEIEKEEIINYSVMV